MAKDWNDLFYTGKNAAEMARPRDETQKERSGFFSRLRDNLAVTRGALEGELRATVFKTLDEEAWERLEELLIFADVGAHTTSEIVEQLEREAEEGQLSSGEELVPRLEELVAEKLSFEDDRIDVSQSPTVLLTVGVNGTGKTTTIGKIAWHLQNEVGLSVLVAAADTFRAAAVEQLEEWAGRAGCDIVKGQQGADSASVVYDAIEAAKARARDVVICDTAGRLHTETNLMEELVKIRRIIERQVQGAPHETLLTIDATTGQNGLKQAELFKEAVEVSGICLTKLDGSAKGGIVLAIANEMRVPIKLVGMGEGLEDLRPFNPQEFASALLE